MKRRPPHIASRWDTACGLSLAFPHRVNPPPPTPATPYPCESITPDFFSFPSSLFLLSIVNFLVFLLCCFYLQCPLSPPPIFTFKAPQLRSRPPRGGFSPLHALERLRRRGKECARAVDPPDIHSLHLRVPEPRWLAETPGEVQQPTPTCQQANAARPSWHMHAF